MLLLNTKTYIATFFTVFLYLVIAILVVYFSSQVVLFGKRVTEFHAPTIFDIKSFRDASSHLSMSLEQNDIPEIMVLMQFEDSVNRLKALSSNWDPLYRKHIEPMISESQKLLMSIKDRKKGKAEMLEAFNQLNKEAEYHVAMHERELEEAKSAIESSSLRIKIVVLVLIVFGVILSFREALIKRLREQEKEKVSAIKAFVVALEARDPYTKGHSLRVADYARIIGKELGLGRKFLEKLELASLLHDIGKIAVPDSVLRNPGSLSEDEWKEMKKHPLVTAQILEGFDSLKVMAKWTLYHHERFDGKGYPEGKKGSDIPLASQIMALCDAFDAMTTTRPYRPGMTLEEAVSEIENCKGKQWGQEVVEAFMKCKERGLICLSLGPDKTGRG